MNQDWEAAKCAGIGTTTISLIAIFIINLFDTSLSFITYIVSSIGAALILGGANIILTYLEIRTGRRLISISPAEKSRSTADEA